MSVATDTRTLQEALAHRVDGEVRFDDGSRATYSTDSSNFRQVPIGVVVPRTVEDGAEAVAVCSEYDAPIVSRGGGTSLAGQCTNEAIVIDWTKYCNQVVSIDAENRRCTVEPGIVLDTLNRELAGYGLRFGPEPATHMNCTLGGMIGNNSCGATAQRTGKVVDNVRSLEVLLYDGTRFTCGPTTDDDYRAIERRGDKRAAVYRALRRLRDEYADLIRERYPDIPRRVSGYNLDALLPENGFDLARALVGSESTLATVLRAELELVTVLPERTVTVLGYPSIDQAADVVPEILPYDPIALEGVDHYLIHDQRLKGLNPDALQRMPDGRGFLMVQFGGETPDQPRRAAEEMLSGLGKSTEDPDVGLFDDVAYERELWQVRESGLGATAHVPHKADTWEGWEDSAVAVEDLGDYLRDLRELYVEFGYASDTGPSLYGHFGQGCVHTRIPFNLYSPAGVERYREFMQRAADLVVSYGGSFSGEHGDGQSRGELLPRMFGREIVDAFERLKVIFDPGNRMNPGKVVHPYRLDDNLRLGGSWAPATPRNLFFSYADDGGSFAQAANRCVGVGKCRQHANDGHQVMCPSYQVTLEEEHSTRGRARLLFEMMNGHPDGTIHDGWRSKDVRDALDLCLACKGCKQDCPANVDMATYKAEFLAHHYAGRLRPRADYALGWLPLLARAVDRTSTAAALNAASRRPLLRRFATAAAGLENRPFPTFASESLQTWFGRRADTALRSERGTVMLWPDTFTNYFSPSIGQAAVDVLESAGWRVEMPSEPVCCGLTWISTGQLRTARRIFRRSLRPFLEHIRAGGLVVGLEPSCTAVLRSDAPDLFHGDQDVNRLKDQTVTFAELLDQHSPGWSPPTAARGQRAIAQVHCHQHAVLGWQADARILDAAGLQAEQLDAGCCGLAGNFGFTKGHGEVSEACAERVLLPRVRDADDDTIVLADGFSCRTQIHQLASGGREGVHLAELVADLQRRDRAGGHTTSDRRD